MSEMEPRDVIAGALEILANEDSWVKHTESRMELETDGWAVHEQSCLWGAFKRAVNPNFYRGYAFGTEELIRVANLSCAAAALVGKVIGEQFADRVDHYFPDEDQDINRIIPFNDHAQTVHSEVIAVLEKTLANEQ